MLRAGTTTAEAKSGYGLTLESELTMLRAIRRLDQEHPIDLVPTLWARTNCLRVPGPSREYVAHVINDNDSGWRAEGLRSGSTCSAQRGVFTPEESLAISRPDNTQAEGADPRQRAGLHGRRVRGSAPFARSADHLDSSTTRKRAPRRRGVVATLLPAAAFYLKLGPLRAREALIDLDVPVALATDVNPGGGFSPSLPFVDESRPFRHGPDARGGADRHDAQRRLRAPDRAEDIAAWKSASDATPSCETALRLSF